MPYDQKLEQRIRRYFDANGVKHEAKRMMGGLCFMVNGKMCVGIAENRLMARIDPAAESDALAKPGCKPMDFTGRPMKGFVFVEPLGIRTSSQLASQEASPSGAWEREVIGRRVVFFVLENCTTHLLGSNS